MSENFYKLLTIHGQVNTQFLHEDVQGVDLSFLSFIGNGEEDKDNNRGLQKEEGHQERISGAAKCD
ncbi:hypothetical protein DSO57_1013566 [Entomophthora muscae]|uniref:Uncharacterized protein n=1 Tax=Entomophthora muscae TaxID=34485 RepID=A0ACC2RKD0_9FUNG|nr:hypothetical protein DSO57_1013566 [Entomophthora muscae]